MVKKSKPGEFGAGREIVAYAAHGRNLSIFLSAIFLSDFPQTTCR
jgi:hypothetical protein